MAKRVRRYSSSHKKINNLWIRLGLSLVFIILAYIVASLAIDSGSLLQYGLTLILAYWALAHAIRGFRYAFAH